MYEPTYASPSAATRLFNLPGYRVVDVEVDEVGGRTVLAETVDPVAGCPSCGVVSRRVHQRTRQRLRDIPVGGAVSVVWVKRRYRCAEGLCARSTFTEHTAQVPAYARSTARLQEAVVDAVRVSRRAVDEVARAFTIGWWTVQRALSRAALAMAAPERRCVRRLGIDEHRFRRVRFFRDQDTGSWQRVEPWMVSFVDLDTGSVIGLVDGRDSAAVRGWLAARPRWWRRRVQVVAIDPSAVFRSAVKPLLPNANVSVDHWHLIKLANDAVTKVRQRVAQERKGRRGRAVDLAWAHRLLLLRAGDRLSARGRAKLKLVLAVDDPTNEIGAAWGIKEQLRQVLAAPTVAEARQRRRLLEYYALVADLPETTKLVSTVAAWWSEIETLVRTRVTNAKTEAANLTIKNTKRTGRGFRNPEHYRCRIMLISAARTTA